MPFSPYNVENFLSGYVLELSDVSNPDFVTTAPQGFARITFQNGQILASQNGGPFLPVGGGGGYSTGVRQIVSAAFTGVSTGSALMLSNDTVPLNTAGTQFMAATITPQSATSSLLITATVGLYYLSAVGTVVSAMFRDSTSEAIAASSQGLGASLGVSQVVNVIAPSGSTAATTFKLRAGPVAASTLTFNGFGGGRYFGGVCASSITITEFGA